MLFFLEIFLNYLRVAKVKTETTTIQKPINFSTFSMASKETKESAEPVQSVWDMFVWIVSNVPWWVVKFIDWIYTVITAFIIRLVSRGSL